MKCPHCGTACHWVFKVADAWLSESGRGSRTGYDLAYDHCPECGKLVVLLRHGRLWAHGDIGEETYEMADIQATEVIYPSATRRDLPAEVPDRFRRDFSEAHAILPFSPKASAALSRRLLQDVLRHQLGIKKSNLAQEIDTFLVSPSVPSHLTEAIDAIRKIGNFAVHAELDRAGEIVDVDAGEAEWLLKILESLFDHAVVEPERLKSRKAALNQKLASANKPPVKDKLKGP